MLRGTAISLLNEFPLPLTTCLTNHLGLPYEEVAIGNDLERSTGGL